MHTNEYPYVKSEKKPYEKPQVVHKEVLEAMATSCTPNGKTAGESGCVGRGILFS